MINAQRFSSCFVAALLLHAEKEISTLCGEKRNEWKESSDLASRSCVFRETWNGQVKWRVGSKIERNLASKLNSHKKQINEEDANRSFSLHSLLIHNSSSSVFSVFSILFVQSEKNSDEILFFPSVYCKYKPQFCEYMNFKFCKEFCDSVCAKSKL